MIGRLRGRRVRLARDAGQESAGAAMSESSSCRSPDRSSSLAVATRVLAALAAGVLAGCAAQPAVQPGTGSGGPSSSSQGTAVSSSVSAVPTSAPAVEPVPANDIDALTERWFAESLALNPVSATFLGEPGYDDRLGNPASAEYRRATRALEEKYLRAAEAMDPNGFTPQQRITYDVFVRDRRLALRGYEFPDDLLPFSQFDSLYATLAVLGSGTSAQPFGTPAEHEAWLRRASEFSAWVDSAIERMREGLKRGVTHPRPVAEKLLPQIDGIVTAKPEDSVFWGPVKMLGTGTGDLPAGFTAADRERLAGEYRRTIDGTLMPAYRKLRAFLADEYIPGCRSTFGWSALPDGARWYAYAAEVSTTVRLDPEEIHALGLSEVARIRGEMEAVMRQVAFRGDLHAFFRHLQTDPRFYYEKPEDLVEGYRAIKRDIDARLPKLFATFPKADYEVRPVEPFRAATAAGASYQSPSPDGKRPGIFYVNTFNLKAQPKFGMETLSLHEAAPGHHFQIAIQQELTGLPRVRRFTNPTAYAEGWALYAESIGKELGLFTDPYQWYGRLSDEMLRAMRLVVDTGLHAKGWSRQRAIDYMLDNSSLAESDVVAEVDRYIVWPGQALGYKIGQLRITAMRAKAERALGAKFDVRAFHDQVLKDGALPLEVLEAKLDRWVAAQQQ